MCAGVDSGLRLTFRSRRASVTVGWLGCTNGCRARRDAEAFDRGDGPPQIGGRDRILAATVHHVTAAPTPLYVVAGAPGAGKTTLLPYLVRLGHGIVTMDTDELLEDGALLGVPIADPAAAPIWPTYNRMWDRIIHMVRRAGHPVLLLSTTPSAEDLAVGRDHAGPVYWALLDCSDEARRIRLQARAWSPESIEDAILDAGQTRKIMHTVISTDDADAEQVAHRILDWITGIDSKTATSVTDH